MAFERTSAASQQMVLFMVLELQGRGIKKFIELQITLGPDFGLVAEAEVLQVVTHLFSELGGLLPAVLVVWEHFELARVANLVRAVGQDLD